MKLTYYGHSAFAVQVANRTLLFDPFITPNALAKNIDINQIAADYILVTHGHTDHIADAVAIGKRTKATVICNFEVGNWLNSEGIEKTHPMNHGGSFRFDFGRVKYVNAIHSSSMPDGTYGGNPGGFVVETVEGNFYVTGDTALTLDMKLIGESTQLSFAVMCIGDNFTMGVDDAIKAADFVGVNEVVGAHYDTFPPIRIDHKQAISKFEAAGKKLYLLKSGEVHGF